MSVAFILLTAVLIALVVFPAYFAAAQSSEEMRGYRISRGAGNDCELIGTWDAETYTCTLTTDVHGYITIGSLYVGGITLDGNGHTLSGESMGSGIWLPRDSTHSTIKNLRILNFKNGIFNEMADYNVFTNNTFDGNERAIVFLSKLCPSASQCTSSWANQVYNNNFLDNNTQVYAYRINYFPDENVTEIADYNFYSQPFPVGGNYWQGWDGPDDDLDGFVDIPYVVDEQRQDALPFTQPDGWLCERSSLTLTGNKPYWASFADYRNRSLSVDFTIENTGTYPSEGLRITACDASGGATCVTAMPYAVGAIAVDSSSLVTLRYLVQEGTAIFQTRLSALYEDSCGNTRSAGFS